MKLRSTLWLVLLTGCAPSMTTVKNYVSASPHRTVAVVPFMLEPRQKDLRQESADIVVNKMFQMGFEIKNHPDPTASMILNGKINLASEAVKEKPAVYKRKQIKTPGQPPRTEKILEHKAEPARARTYSATLTLIDAATQNVVWQQTTSNAPGNWTLEEMARYELESLLDDLGDAYINKRL